MILTLIDFTLNELLKENNPSSETPPCAEVNRGEVHRGREGEMERIEKVR